MIQSSLNNRHQSLLQLAQFGAVERSAVISLLLHCKTNVNMSRLVAGKLAFVTGL